MTTKELIHVVKGVHVFTPAAISATTTATLDTFRAESAAFLVDIMGGNFGASVGVALTLQESDASGSGFTAVANMFVEWAMDGIAGYPDNTGGIWVPQPMAYMSAPVSLNPMTLQHANFQGHIFTVSYVNGQHRYLNLNLAPVGAPTNMVVVQGLLNSLTETLNKTFHNYPVPADFPSIAFPT